MLQQDNISTVRKTGHFRQARRLGRYCLSPHDLEQKVAGTLPTDSQQLMSARAAHIEVTLLMEFGGVPFLAGSVQFAIHDFWENLSRTDGCTFSISSKVPWHVGLADFVPPSTLPAHGMSRRLPNKNRRQVVSLPIQLYQTGHGLFMCWCASAVP